MTTTVETKVVKLDEIEVAEGFNAREGFDEKALGELAASIKQNGITTALTVRSENGHYALIDGERRYRAAKQAGLKQVPVLVRSGERAEVASLVANIQREDLNRIEEAKALARLKELEGLGTNKALAEAVGKPVAFVAGRLRLLGLPEGCHAGIGSETVPVAAEPVLRKVAKASPELAVAACAAVKAGRFEPAELVERPEAVVSLLAQDDGKPFVCDVTSGATIAELVAHGSHREALEARADEALDDGSGYADHRYLRLKDQDIDRLRASGTLLEFEPESEWMADRAFLVDPELAADLAEELVDREIKAREVKAAEVAEKAGVKVDGEGSAAEQLAEAEREERRKAREQSKRDAEKAIAANSALGVELVKRRGAQTRKAHRLNRAKVLARRVIVDNQQLPGAGLRLALPQLREVEIKTLKGGEERQKVDYAGSERCREYLLDAVERAKSVDEVIELITDAMIAAELADERAVAQSRRIHWHAGYPNPVTSGLADEIKEVRKRVGSGKRR